MWFRCCLFNMSCKTCKCKSPTDAHNAPVWLDDNKRNTHTHRKKCAEHHLILWTKTLMALIWIYGKWFFANRHKSQYIMNHVTLLKNNNNANDDMEKSVLKEECSHLFQYPCHCFARGRRTECTQNTVFNNDDCIGEQCT